MYTHTMPKYPPAEVHVPSLTRAEPSGVAGDDGSAPGNSQAGKLNKEIVLQSWWDGKTERRV